MLRIAFRYTDSRWGSRLICWWQRHDSAHCEVVLSSVGDEHLCGSASWVDGGVRTKKMALPAEKWRVYEIAGDSDAAWEWFDRHDGERYDVVGLIGIVVRPIKHWLKAWFCSEVAATLLGLRDPWRYDLATLESVCSRHGQQVQ